MEKRKNKKKLAAIIGGSVLAFVLTIALSVSVTLAYFGDWGSATGKTITMAQALEFSSNPALSVTDNITNALPGDSAPISMTFTIKANAATGAFLRFKLGATGKTDVITFTNPTIESGITGAFLKQSGEYWYVVTTEGGETLKEITLADNVTVKVTGTYSIATSVTNSNAGSTITVAGEAAIVQSKNAPKAQGATESTISDLVTANAFPTTDQPGPSST